MPKSDLEKALDHSEKIFPDDLPRVLPIGHTSSVEHLTSILQSRRLQPKYCRVMKKQTLYLFYGSLFYRSTPIPTQEQTHYPVGFLFHHKTLGTSDVHYPFDTGAMSRGYYGKIPTEFKTFKLSLKVQSANLIAAKGKDCSHALRLMVKHLFKTNPNYLRGRPDSQAVNKKAPIPRLLQFFQDNNGTADHRRTSIEIQRKLDLPLDDERLLWIGYPDTFEGLIQNYIRTLDPHVPETWAYPALNRFRPSDICAQLEQRASEITERNA